MQLLVVRDRKLWNPTTTGTAPAPEPVPELVKRFDATISIEAKESKSFTAIKTGDLITDYQDVRVRGYLSTFSDARETDRQGEYVLPGAFKDTIKSFMTNPVMLRDHINMVSHLVGGFERMQEDVKGLYVEALLSNAPDVRDTRFKVAEGHLRTMSIGGFWHFKEDGRGIFKADLFEGSLTPVPANPKAVFQTRSLRDEDVKYLKALGRMDIADRLGLKLIAVPPVEVAV